MSDDRRSRICSRPSLRRRTLAELKAFCRIPASAPIRPFATACARAAFGGAPIVGAPASQSSRSPRPAVIRRFSANGSALRPARRPSWSTATTTCSRPIRSRMDHPAVRADGPRRPPLCARRLRRQGADADPDPGRRGVPAGNWPAAGQLKMLIEGEEEVGSAHFARSSSGCANALPATSSSRPTAPCGAPTCRR